MALIKIKQVDGLGTQLTNLGTSITAAGSDAISAAGSLDTVLEGELQAYADSAESDAISHADGLDAAMNTRVTTIETTILADTQFLVETFTGVTAGATQDFTVNVPADVQNDLPALVWAFVNGVRITVVSAAATVVTLNAAYAIDATDVITIQYQSVDTP